MWGNPRSRSDLTLFSSLWHELRRARQPGKGKPLQNNTRAFLREGTMDDPKVIAVRLHSTDILRFHSDGSLEVTQSSWNSSVTTRDRLWNYGRVNVGYYNVPPVNGYRTFPSRVIMLWPRRGKNIGVAIGTDTGYVKIKPDGDVDMSTVTPHTVHYVKDSLTLRRKMAKMNKVIRLLAGYVKLKGGDDIDGWVTLRAWLEARLDVPLEEISLSPFPYYFQGNLLIPQLKQTLNNMRRDIAMREKCLAPYEVLSTESRTAA